LADSLATSFDFSLADNQAEIWFISKAILITALKLINYEILF